MAGVLSVRSGNHAIGSQSIERVGERRNRILIVEEAELSTEGHVIEGFDFATEVSVGMPERCNLGEMIWPAVLGNNAIPDQSGIGRLASNGPALPGYGAASIPK